MTSNQVVNLTFVPYDEKRRLGHRVAEKMISVFQTVRQLVQGTKTGVDLAADARARHHRLATWLGAPRSAGLCFPQAPARRVRRWLLLAWVSAPCELAQTERGFLAGEDPWQPAPGSSGRSPAAAARLGGRAHLGARVGGEARHPDGGTAAASPCCDRRKRMDSTWTAIESIHSHRPFQLSLHPVNPVHPVSRLPRRTRVRYVQPEFAPPQSRSFRVTPLRSPRCFVP